MYQGLIIDIQKIAGKWLINGKQYVQCSRTEQLYFSHFLKHMSYGDIEGVR